MENTGIFLGLVPLKFQRKPKATINENSVVNTVAKHFRFLQWSFQKQSVLKIIDLLSLKLKVTPLVFDSEQPLVMSWVRTPSKK